MRRSRPGCRPTARQGSTAGTAGRSVEVRRDLGHVALGGEEAEHAAGAHAADADHPGRRAELLARRGDRVVARGGLNGSQRHRSQLPAIRSVLSGRPRRRRSPEAGEGPAASGGRVRPGPAASRRGRGTGPSARPPRAGRCSRGPGRRWRRRRGPGRAPASLCRTDSRSRCSKPGSRVKTWRRSSGVTYGWLIAEPSAARAASTRPSRSVDDFARTESASKMRTRSRIDTPSSSNACNTRCTSPRVSSVGVSSSTTTGCVRRTISTRRRTSSRPSRSAAFCRTTSARWVVMTDERSTTVAPAISACRCSSTGTHLAASPNTGSRVALPGSPSRLSPMARTVPAGEMPLAAGTPLSQMTYCEPGRSRLSRVRTSGMTRPVSMATLRRSALTRSSRSPPRAGVDELDQVEGDLELERVDPHLLGDGLGGVRLGLVVQRRRQRPRPPRRPPASRTSGRP